MSVRELLSEGQSGAEELRCLIHARLVANVETVPMKMILSQDLGGRRLDRGIREELKTIGASWLPWTGVRRQKMLPSVSAAISERGHQAGEREA